MKHPSCHIFLLFARRVIERCEKGGEACTVFQEIRPRAGFETGDSFKKSSGGYRRTPRESRLIASRLSAQFNGRF